MSKLVQLHPVPFTTFVVKVASRCNLNCSYCYMYNLADRTYRDQPKLMSPATTSLLADRIAAHAASHRLAHVHVILHGGEPLLLGKRRLAEWVTQVRRIIGAVATPHFSMQSNGVLIDDEWIDVLARLRVGIGISVDGPRAYHDAYRVDHHGRGSFDAVVEAIRRLNAHPRGPEVFSTVMAVVNTDIPPRELFDFWQALDVSGFDLSLPHANHKHRPPAGRMSYGEWLIEFFDLWFRQNREDRRVRYFDNMLRMFFGYPLSTDNIGGKPVGVVVVETDGSIEPTDAFKCCAEGITKLGLNIAAHDFDDLYGLPLVTTLQHGTPALCETCRQCAFADVCGGGYMPHRYATATGFDNPSVYCDDLKQLLHHMQRKVIASLPTPVAARIAAAGGLPLRHGNQPFLTVT